MADLKRLISQILRFKSSEVNFNIFATSMLLIWTFLDCIKDGYDLTSWEFRIRFWTNWNYLLTIIYFFFRLKYSVNNLEKPSLTKIEKDEQHLYKLECYDNEVKKNNERVELWNNF